MSESVIWPADDSGRCVPVNNERPSGLFRRYGPGARWYDVLSMENAIYRAGRIAVVHALHIQPGERVLDIGCGTGLSLPFLADAVGEHGQVVGLDRSEAMLVQARRRVADNAWGSRVTLVTGSATTPPHTVGADFDVVLFGYSLGVMDDWEQAWDRAVATLRPGGRIAVVDSAWPTGRWRLLTPAAAGAFVLGGVHPARQVCTYLQEHTTDSMTQTLRGGHIRLAVGTVATDQRAH